MLFLVHFQKKSVTYYLDYSAASLTSKRVTSNKLKTNTFFSNFTNDAMHVYSQLRIDVHGKHTYMLNTIFYEFVTRHWSELTSINL